MTELLATRWQAKVTLSPCVISKKRFTINLQSLIGSYSGGRNYLQHLKFGKGGCLSAISLRVV